MCRFKSAIILKDRVFVPGYDSHTDMLEELKIQDTKANAQRLFIRAELYPENGDEFSNIDTWCFNVDQDILPDWYVEEYDKQRMIDAVKAWAKNRIHIGVDGLRISGGDGHRIKDCKNVDIYGSATVESICGNAAVKDICGNAAVKDICGNATVKYICGNAAVKDICDSATVERICDSATVKNIYGNATVERICDSATVKYICDSATVKLIYGSATVEYICGNATVKLICGSATVKLIYGSATVEYICDSATVITSAFTKWDNLSKAKLSDNATIKDRLNKIIYQSGDWTFKAVKNEE